MEPENEQIGVSETETTYDSYLDWSRMKKKEEEI